MEEEDRVLAGDPGPLLRGARHVRGRGVLLL